MEQNKNYTIWLAAVMIAVFILQNIFPVAAEQFILVSQDVLTRPWTLITAIFMHGSITHILFNGFGLVIFGTLLEQMIGSKRFLMVFFATGILGNIASLPYPAVLGASGAVFGILGTITIMRPNLLVYVYFIPMPMYIAAFVWAIVDLFGVFFPSGTANLGHLAGLGAGLILGMIMRGKLPTFDKRNAKPLKPDEIMTVEEFEQWENNYMKK
jgi:uncharacterized protein